MSAESKGKRTAAETLEALERQAAEDEMDRILALGDAELDAELAEAGFDPKAERARGAGMAEQALGVADDLASDGRASDELERDDAEAQKAKVVPLSDARRPSRVVWLVAAGFALVAGAVAATQGAAIVAWLRGGEEPIQPANEPPRPPSPHQLAEKARDEAEAACARQLWGLCNDKLDEARKIDPAGESEERVQRLRQDVHDGTTLEPGPPEKGGQR